MGERRTEESLVSWLRLYQGQLAATGRNATVEVFPEGVQRYWAEAVDVMRVLGAMKSRRAAPVLRALMRQSYNKHGSDAMKALGKIGDQEAIPLIMARFDHEHANPFDYADGAAALRSINAAEAVRLLSKRLTASSARTRHRAAWVLRELKDKRSAPALLARVDDKDLPAGESRPRTGRRRRDLPRDPRKSPEILKEVRCSPPGSVTANPASRPAGVGAV